MAKELGKVIKKVARNGIEYIEGHFVDNIYLKIIHHFIKNGEIERTFKTLKEEEKILLETFFKAYEIFPKIPKAYLKEKDDLKKMVRFAAFRCKLEKKIFEGDFKNFQINMMKLYGYSSINGLFNEFKMFVKNLQEKEVEPSKLWNLLDYLEAINFDYKELLIQDKRLLSLLQKISDMFLDGASLNPKEGVSFYLFLIYLCTLYDSKISKKKSVKVEIRCDDILNVFMGKGEGEIKTLNLHELIREKMSNLLDRLESV
ncbi:MAG: hypothetical protein ACP6IP_05625 [Candidatus Njordarchaeia archaeon]